MPLTMSIGITQHTNSKEHIMARITTVKKARKDQGLCEHCRTEITAGMSYRWCAPGGIGAPKRKRHTACPTWTRSDLSSSKMTTVWAAQDEFSVDADVHDYIDDETCTFDAAGFLDAVREALTVVADAARETADDYQEGIDALPDSLQYGPTAEESREKVDALESYADDLESFEPSADYDESSVVEEVDAELADDVDDDYRHDARLTAITEAAEQYAEQVIDEANDIVQNFDY